MALSDLLGLLHEKFDSFVLFLDDFFFPVEYFCEFILVMTFGDCEFFPEGVNFAFLSLDDGLKLKFSILIHGI